MQSSATEKAKEVRPWKLTRVSAPGAAERRHTPQGARGRARSPCRHFMIQSCVCLGVCFRGGGVFPPPPLIRAPASHPAVLCCVPPSGRTPWGSLGGVQHSIVPILSERSSLNSACLHALECHAAATPSAARRASHTSVSTRFLSNLPTRQGERPVLSPGVAPFWVLLWFVLTL